VKRNALIKEVQDIQAQLGAGKEDADPEWRRTALHALNAKQNELRRIKDWLRKNDVAKQGEWALLGRAYRFLDSIEIHDDDTPFARDVYSLLDAIEKTIPGKYLSNETG
jgi:hypothetical protein